MFFRMLQSIQYILILGKGAEEMAGNMENRPERRLCVGLLAHVDAGKTTLSEAMLYCGGCLKKLGRVDHADAFLDTDRQERERGITIFSKQAVLPMGELELTLLDTPGHVDFSTEMERTLSVLDYGVLVVSGTDGVQGHTMTLWRLLERYHIPTFLFINKMDLPGADRKALLAELKARLDDGCVDFGGAEGAMFEEIATCGEEALEQFLDRGRVDDGEIAALISARRLFPCFFGAALKLDGVEELLRGLERYTHTPAYPAEFRARVYKIARDPQGVRLTYLKVTGGQLKVKTLLRGGEGDGAWEEKADQIRVYSGAKFRAVDTAEAGTVCAVTGLSRTYPGQGLGGEELAGPPALEPVFSYRVVLPPDQDPHTALGKLRELAEEDPQLHILWNAQLREIHLQLMGEVQLEVLRRMILERFGLAVDFAPGGVVYRETIAAPVEGVGHYEPLRHYAEVHLLLEPAPRGSGLTFAAACGEEMLDFRWQRLILTHLEEKTHLGVLTGSPITDMKITLIAGRAHEKHTEGGDFRQATYRAVRQGLMTAQSVLLEPWYDFTLAVPSDCVGRAMADLQRRNGRVAQPEPAGEETVLTGAAPAARLRDYAGEVAAYTRGRGRLSCALRGYEPCADQAAVAETLGYDPEGDLDNTPDSVFCAHGAGFNVKWDQVPRYMHVESPLRQRAETPPDGTSEVRTVRADPGGLEQDRELQAIFERTYGKVERRAFEPQKKPARTSLDEKYTIKDRQEGPEYLLVDGYNIIFAWEELKAAAQADLDDARRKLMEILSNYQGFRKCRVILVFDAYRVKGGVGSVIRWHNIHVVYTKEAETADAYIEKTTYELARNYRVRVATSDGAEQVIILGHGALRLSATAFRAEVEQALGQISAILAENNRREKSRPVETAMEKARERER